jgi:hypothetical protein
VEDGSPLSPPRLEYATPASEARVLYTREGDRATVVIPRPERRTQAAWNSTGDLLGEVLFYLIVGAVIVAWFAPIWLLVLFPGMTALIACVFGLCWLGHARLARPIVVELTSTELSFSNLDDHARTIRLLRNEIYAIYNVSHAKSVFVRRRGKEMLGFMLTPDVSDSERIATFLRDAIALEPGATSEHPLASSPPA